MSDNSAPGWMSEDHLALEDMVKRFFAAEMMPNLEGWRAARQVEHGFWIKAGQAGLLGATVSTDYGGSGGPRSFDAVIAREHGRTGDPSWGFGVHNFVTHYIQSYGTEPQKHRWLPGLVSGKLVGAIAMTEPGAGTDLKSIRTQAILESADGYVVNGSKTFITNGQTANLICLAVKTNPELGHKGISLLMVETDDAQGFRRGRNLEKLAQKGQDTSELFFDDMHVPKGNLLGEVEGQGFVQLMQQLPWERLCLGLVALGASELALELTLEYVNERKIFDQRLMDFQNTRFKLAEAKTKIEVTSAFLEKCVRRFEAGTLDVATAAMVKWWASQIQCDIADECLQLFGGYGYMDEYPISRLFADARVQKIYGGANEVMKEIIARDLDRALRFN